MGNQKGASGRPDGSMTTTRASFRNYLDLSEYVYSPQPSATSNPFPKLNPLSTIAKHTVSAGKRKFTGEASPRFPKRHQTISTCYAPPSQYAHLPELQDVLAPNLICMFIGLNPGLQTAVSGHAYAHPSNLFWKLLHSSGCTPRRCHSTEDVDLPRLYALGFTNIVSRPTRNGSELKMTDIDAGVQVLEEKTRRFKPEAVCIVGKSIWDSIQRTRHGKSAINKNFKYGWQDEIECMGREKNEGLSWKGAKVFVACSTSGLAASLKPAQKEAIWRELGVWVKERRAQRKE
ncbi:hypothetical protein K3495_g11020 [Podosphaera aphanis]|nr:hypothetical protein K3495_g11020 [Podosphaera aphanis]